jgi:response regulator RpfG family c-di-GMP phosphodiesterase
MKRPIRFVVIDDDRINNMLCTIVIGKVASNCEIKTFESPEEGLEYFRKGYTDNGVPTVLFLDINMPTWSGWDYLYNFDMLEKDIKDQVIIFMLSSSVDPSDKQRAVENKNVTGYLEKPITTEKIELILEGWD